MDAFVSGAWRTPHRGEVIIAGVWRQLVRAEIYRDGAWHACLSFISPLSVSVSPGYVQGIGSPNKPTRQTLTTNSATATPVGGNGPYSYAWSAPAGITITNQGNATTAFRASVGPDQEISGVATVICTDSSGKTASGQVEYYLYNQTNR
jgi:hypothetical protein